MVRVYLTIWPTVTHSYVFQSGSKIYYTHHRIQRKYKAIILTRLYAHAYISTGLMYIYLAVCGNVCGGVVHDNTRFLSCYFQEYHEEFVLIFVNLICITACVYVSIVNAEHQFWIKTPIKRAVLIAIVDITAIHKRRFYASSDPTVVGNTYFMQSIKTKPAGSVSVLKGFFLSKILIPVVLFTCSNYMLLHIS